MESNKKGCVLILVFIINFLIVITIVLYFLFFKESTHKKLYSQKESNSTNNNLPSIEDCNKILTDQERYEKEALRLFKKNKEWRVVAESPTHKIYMKGGSIFTVVLDKKLDLLLTPDQSCEINISENEKNEEGAFFYNSTVGIEEKSAYKLIYYDELTDEFVQKVSITGCLYEEGRIKVWTDEDLKVVKCDVKIESVLVGC